MERMVKVFATAVGVLLYTAGAAADCGVRRQLSPEGTVASAEPCAQGASREEAYVRDLAYRFRYAEVTNEESAAIFAEVRALAPASAVLFNEALIGFATAEIVAEGRQPTDDELQAMEWSRVLTRYAAEVQVSAIDLEEEDAMSLLAEAVRMPRSPEANRVSCYLAPPMPNWMYGASCGRNCKPATGFDRASTQRWETCDFRIFFRSSSRLRNIDGKTTQADCVVLKYGSLISRYASGNTEAIVGAWRTAACRVFTGSYLQANLQAF